MRPAARAGPGYHFVQTVAVDIALRPAADPGPDGCAVVGRIRVTDSTEDGRHVGNFRRSGSAPRHGVGGGDGSCRTRRHRPQIAGEGGRVIRRRRPTRGLSLVIQERRGPRSTQSALSSQRNVGKTFGRAPRSLRSNVPPGGPLVLRIQPHEWLVLADSGTAGTTINAERAEFAEKTLGKSFCGLGNLCVRNVPPGCAGVRNRPQAAARASVPSQKSVGIRPALHPGWLRCSSLKYSRYSRSSRLAIRAHRRPRCSTDF